jgi:hypothetical protein
MNPRLLFFGVVIACVSATGGFLWGYHKGDEHALDTMRLIGCQNPDVESFQMHEIPPDKGDPL